MEMFKVTETHDVENGESGPSPYGNMQDGWVFTQTRTTASASIEVEIDDRENGFRVRIWRRDRFTNNKAASSHIYFYVEDSTVARVLGMDIANRMENLPRNSKAACRALVRRWRRDYPEGCEEGAWGIVLKYDMDDHYDLFDDDDYEHRPTPRWLMDEINAPKKHMRKHSAYYSRKRGRSVKKSRKLRRRQHR